MSRFHQLAQQDDHSAVIHIGIHIVLLYEKPPCCSAFEKRQGGSLLKFDYCLSLPVFLTLLPQARNDLRSFQGRNGNCAWPHITGISPLRGSLRAALIANGCDWTGVPTPVLSSQDRSARICFMDGRIRSPPYLPLSCSYLHRWIFALPPMSLPILCLYKAHRRTYFRFWIFTWVGTRMGFFRVPEKFPSLLIQFQKYP